MPRGSCQYSVSWPSWCLEQDVERRADQRAAEPADAAEDDEDDQLAREVPGEHRRADEAVEVGVERPGEAGDHRREDEGGEADVERADADAGQAQRVLPGHVEGEAEARAGRHQDEAEHERGAARRRSGRRSRGPWCRARRGLLRT